MAYSIIYRQFTPCSVIYTSDRSFVQNKEDGIRQIQHQIVGNTNKKGKNNHGTHNIGGSDIFYGSSFRISICQVISKRKIVVHGRKVR